MGSDARISILREAHARAAPAEQVFIDAPGNQTHAGSG